jgi:hypothetical protein
MKVYEFDIKGSLKNRISKDMKGTLKDLNLLEIQKKNKNELIVDLSTKERLHLYRIIKKDSIFLYKQGVMDYSLLINVE